MSVIFGIHRELTTMEAGILPSLGPLRKWVTNPQYDKSTKTEIFFDNSMTNKQIQQVNKLLYTFNKPRNNKLMKLKQKLLGK